MAALSLALAEAVGGSIAGSALAFGSIAAIGLLGVMDSLLGEDESVSDDDPGDEGGDLFDDDAVASGGDDEFAFDDDGGGGGGEFDEFDVEGMEGEEGQGAQGSVPQIEGRIDEVEAELESLSSTVSTVRTENEQIGESVEEVEENVRKLLEIYKMVTKGVNPFVDEAGGEAVAAAPGDESLGLFDEDEEGEEGDLGDDVADADAEEFFDDELEEEFDEDDELEEGELEEDELEDEDDLEEDSGGGKSFDDLREEYEGESEWEEDALDGDDEQDESTAAPSPQPARGAEGEKPYLREIPCGYVTDLLVTEWIEYLVSEAGPASVERAITYYEHVEWIDRRAADQLRAFLSGHPDSDTPESAASGALSMDHHTTSLQYIARIDGGAHPEFPAQRREPADEDVLRH